MDLVIEWCWRGVVLAVGVITLADRWPHASAATRYQIAWLALAASVALPLVHVLPEVTPGTGTVASTAAAPVRGLVSVDRVPPVVIVAGLCAWALWILGGSVRLVMALAALHRVRRHCRPFPGAHETRLPAWLAHRDRARAARLVLSDDVRGAAVFGLWSPLIAVSPAVAKRLSPGELDRIVVHELAHVARWDDWADLLQVVIRALVGWHPAVWWLDRRLHAEREAACDDWVVALTGDAVPYAASLVKLADLQRAAGRPLRLAPGALSRSQLSARVSRLLDRRQNRSIRGSRPVVAAVAAFALGLWVQLSAIDLVVPSGRTPRPSAPLAIETLAPAPDLGPRRPPPKTARTAQPRVTTVARTTVRPRAESRERRPAGTAAMAVGARVDTDTLTARPIESWTGVPADARPVAQPMAATGLGSRMMTTLPLAPAPVSLSRSLDGERRDGAPAPWTAAADGGVAVGQSSRKAAVATAGFFTRLGKSIGGAF